MLVEKIPLTLLKVVHKTGTSKKSGNAYSFHTANVVDDEANVFQLNLEDSLSTQSGLTELRNVKIVADINFTPKDYDISGTIVNFEIED